VTWARVWCVFELYHSLVGHKQGYTFDIYTAVKHVVEKYVDVDTRTFLGAEERLAVGLTAGVAPADESEYWQTARQQHFPLELTDIGTTFDSMQGKASVLEDEERIKSAIKDKSELLNGTVHGQVANAVLNRVMKEGGSRVEQYLAAIKEGHVRQVYVTGDIANETVALLVDSLNACEALRMMSNNLVTVLPPSLGKLQVLTSLDLLFCKNLSELPPSLGELQALTSLNLSDCVNLRELPPSLGELQALTSLNLNSCKNLSELPPSLDKLQALTSLNLGGSTLSELPPSLGKLQALTSLDLRRCKNLSELPPSLCELPALTSLQLGWCNKLSGEECDALQQIVNERAAAKGSEC